MNMPKSVKTAKKTVKQAAKKVKAPKKAVKKGQAPEKGELTPKLFIELSQKMVRALISKLAERITTPGEDMNKILSELQQEVGKEILPEGITMEDIGNFGRAHNSEIEAYLKANPKIKAQMDKLEKEFKAAMHPEQKKPTKKVELTPKLYIDLTLKMLPLLLNRLDAEFKEHKEEIEQAGPGGAMEIIMGILLNIRLAIGKEILPEGITDEDMEQYKRDHEAEINDYCENNPEIKKKLEDLQKEFEAKFPQ
jgi:hypothetical protein